MRNPIEAPSSERGAVLVHVALALIALMSFSTFVIDYGVLWTARRQAQNAADAAALAGAVALSFDDPNDRSDTGPAKTSAYQVVMSHPIWGQQPVVNISTDITVFSCPDDLTTTCVRVDVYRDTFHGNALPMIFGQLVGLDSQNVRAMAMAKAAPATATNCLKPWAVVDRWEEHHPIDPGPFTPTSTFDKYKESGGIVLDPSITPPDLYVPPTTTSTGSGFFPYNPDKLLSADYGMPLSLTLGDGRDFRYASGWFAALSLPNSRGGSDYSENIKRCVGIDYEIGQEVDLLTVPKEESLASTVASVSDDGDALINQDPNAVWDPTLNGGHGGVANSAYAVSPRIVAVPLIDPEAMIAASQSGRTRVPVINIMAFFVERWDFGNQAVVGRLVTTSGRFQVGTTSPIGGQSSFLHAIILIR